MYSNIPIIISRHVFNNIMIFNLLYSHTNLVLLTWYDTITKQNYLTNKNNTNIQNDGLARVLYLLATFQ